MKYPTLVISINWSVIYLQKVESVRICSNALMAVHVWFVNCVDIKQFLKTFNDNQSLFAVYWDMIALPTRVTLNDWCCIMKSQPKLMFHILEEVFLSAPVISDINENRKVTIEMNDSNYHSAGGLRYYNNIIILPCQAY